MRIQPTPPSPAPEERRPPAESASRRQRRQPRNPRRRKKPRNRRRRRQRRKSERARPRRRPRNRRRRSPDQPRWRAGRPPRRIDRPMDKLFPTLRLLWIASEIQILWHRRPGGPAPKRDAGTLRMLVVVIGAGAARAAEFEGRDGAS